MHPGAAGEESSQSTTLDARNQSSPGAVMAATWPHTARATPAQPLRGAPLDSACSSAPVPAAAKAAGRASASQVSARTGGGAGGRGGKRDQAVTFQTAIKSSGYGLTFPKARLGKAPPKPRQANVHGRPSHGLLPAHWGAKDVYPWAGEPPCRAGDSRKALGDSCAALHVSLDGERVVVASGAGQFAVLPSDLTGCVRLPGFPAQIQTAP